MSWYCVRLDDSQLAAYQHERIRAQFEEFFVKSKRPTDMAMFRGATDGNAIRFYFSPATGAHAHKFLLMCRAVPCERPSEQLNLAVGQQGSLERFLSGGL